MNITMKIFDFIFHKTDLFILKYLPINLIFYIFFNNSSIIDFMKKNIEYFFVGNFTTKKFVSIHFCRIFDR